MKVEINHKMKAGKNLNNLEIMRLTFEKPVGQKEIEEIKIFLELNENENTATRTSHTAKPIF